MIANVRTNISRVIIELFSLYSVEDLIKRLRDRMAGSWNPFYGGSDFSHSGPGVWPIEIPDDDSAEDAQTNTTSEVKVINCNISWCS